MECNDAKKLVIKAGHELVKSGLIARTWGNVSCRIDERTFAITPSGREYNTLTVDDIVIINIDDLSYTGTIKPSSEKGIHRAVYKLRPEINFVIHTHQENASAISASGVDYFRPSPEFSALGKTIVCSKYALPGTKALCKNVTDSMKISPANAFILKHHGTLCIGRSYDDTFQTAHLLEAACGAYLKEKDARIQSEVALDTHPSRERTALAISLTSWKKCGQIIINTDPDVVRYAKLGISMRPLLDDFAQLVGTRIKAVDNKPNLIFASLNSAAAVIVKDIGAVCWGSDQTDAEAVSMIVRKNCMAYFASSAISHPKYIRPWECLLMRHIYLKKYSIMSVGNKIGEDR